MERKGKQTYFGSQFENAVHCDGDAKATGAVSLHLQSGHTNTSDFSSILLFLQCRTAVHDRMLPVATVGLPTLAIPSKVIPHE